jgi:beta-xylosidase
LTKNEVLAALIYTNTMIKKGLLTLAGITLTLTLVFSQNRVPAIRQDVPLDSIRLSDPFILADKKTSTYYMTGTGGLMWKSNDLKKWTGPFTVAQTDPDSWMGKNPMIWAAELHPYNDKYYYFATFTNRAVKIDTVGEHVIERRARHVLVSDKAEGPYVPIKDPIYPPISRL